MHIDTSKPYHIGYNWEDGPSESYATEEEAKLAAKALMDSYPANTTTVYIFKLIDIIKRIA